MPAPLKIQCPTSREISSQILNVKIEEWTPRFLSVIMAPPAVLNRQDIGTNGRWKSASDIYYFRRRDQRMSTGLLPSDNNGGLSGSQPLQLTALTNECFERLR